MLKKKIKTKTTNQHLYILQKHIIKYKYSVHLENMRKKICE